MDGEKMGNFCREKSCFEDVLRGFNGLHGVGPDLGGGSEITFHVCGSPLQRPTIYVANSNRATYYVLGTRARNSFHAPQMSQRSLAYAHNDSGIPYSFSARNINNTKVGTER